MSDVRALLAGRGLAVSDGSYLERDDKAPLALEELLRSGISHLAFLAPNHRRPFLALTQSHEAHVMTLANEALATALRQAVRPMQKHGFKDELLAQAFAVVREASRRALGMRHHDVQLLAGRTLLQGKIAEMATGEGKTLAATLAVCTAAATGAAVHVVTVNDYLASRDAEPGIGFLIGGERDLDVELGRGAGGVGTWRRTLVGRARLADLQLREIVSFTARGNRRSLAVMKRLGMLESGTFEHPHVPETTGLR